MPGAVKVRGTCPAGHVTEAEAPKGRVTWNGECMAEGCDRQVLCRRIPKDRTPPAGPPADSQYPFVEVTSYEQLGDEQRADAGIIVDEPEHQDDAAGSGADVHPAEQPAAGPGSEGGRERPAPPLDPVDQPRRGISGRARDALRSRRQQAEWRHPLTGR